VSTLRHIQAQVRFKVGLVFPISVVLVTTMVGCQDHSRPNLVQEAHPEANEEGHGRADLANQMIELSPQALQNIGYVPHIVALGNYRRTISLPGMIVERRGQSQIRVSTPLGGVIARSHVMPGEAIAEGSVLFEIQLVHEELGAAQGAFLESAEALDVVNAEIRRLESATEGVIAGRRILEQKYERRKIEARLRAQREGLLLHGLSDVQIDHILKTRELLKSMTIHAPTHKDCATCRSDHPYHVQSLAVQIGQQVEAGETLCVLADHCELYIEGTAFEADIPNLRKALETGSTIDAYLSTNPPEDRTVCGLKLLYLSDQVDRQSRATHFYVQLPNEIVLDRREGSRRFVQWRFIPGQRMELLLPVEQWTDRLVLPAEALVHEGAETYVYRQSGERFHRVPVHVEYRDGKSAVIANDGSIFPGEIIAAHGAFQIHLALKNRSSSAFDPHSGHNH